MTQSTSPTPLEQASAARIRAIVHHGFTERQARFLALVMRHAGVCVPRQYSQVAGIAQGAKCNAFFDRLVRRGHARAIECVHNRARLYLVHSRLLYHAIGEPSSRYRRPVSPRLALERLMLLDAMLYTPAGHWLATAAEKAAALLLTAEMKVSDTFLVGVQADGRIVVLYLGPEPWPDAFRTFLRAYALLLPSLPKWTIRIVLPRRFGHAYDEYQRAVYEELEAGSASSTAISDALDSGAGRVESFVLPHSYRHLSPLVGRGGATNEEVEKGVEEGDHRGDTARRRSQPTASTPWRPQERVVVM